MRAGLAVMLLVSLLLAGMLMFCHRHELQQIRDDYQAYQKKNLLPEDYGSDK